MLSGPLVSQKNILRMLYVTKQCKEVLNNYLNFKILSATFVLELLGQWVCQICIVVTVI